MCFGHVPILWVTALLSEGKEHTIDQRLIKTVAAESKKGEMTDFQHMSVESPQDGGKVKSEETEESEDLKLVMTDLRLAFAFDVHQCQARYKTTMSCTRTMLRVNVKLSTA